MSDADGVSSNTNYAYGEDCAWTIQCPTGYPYIGVAVSTSLARDSTLTLTDAASATHAFTYTSASTLYHYYKAPLAVTFTSSMWYTPGFGFTLAYECRQWPCSDMRNSRISLNPARRERITSSGTTTFATANHYADNEECDFDVACPDGKKIVVNELALTTITPSNRVTVYLPNNTCLAYYATSSSSMHLDSQYARVRWSTDTTVLRTSTSYDFKYTCAARRCSSQSNDTNRAYNLSTGTIMSDWDETFWFPPPPHIKVVSVVSFTNWFLQNCLHAAWLFLAERAMLHVSNFAETSW